MTAELCPITNVNRWFNNINEFYTDKLIVNLQMKNNIMYISETMYFLIEYKE